MGLIEMLRFGLFLWAVFCVSGVVTGLILSALVMLVDRWLERHTVRDAA